MIKHLGILEKIARLYQFPEGIMVHEMIIHAVFLARAHGPGSIGHGQYNIRGSVKQIPDQAGFPGPRRGGDDKEPALRTRPAFHCTLLFIHIPVTPGPIQYSGSVPSSVRSTPSSPQRHALSGYPPILTPVYWPHD